MSFLLDMAGSETLGQVFPRLHVLSEKRPLFHLDCGDSLPEQCSQHQSTVTRCCCTGLPGRYVMFWFGRAGLLPVIYVTGCPKEPWGFAVLRLVCGRRRVDFAAGGRVMPPCVVLRAFYYVYI